MYKTSQDVPRRKWTSWPSSMANYIHGHVWITTFFKPVQLIKLVIHIYIFFWLIIDYVKAQAQPQPLLADEEYYDEEPIDEQPPQQAGPQQPVAQPPPPPPPPPPAVTRPSSLFARPSPGRLSTIRQTTTTQAPIREPEPDPPAPVPAPSPARGSARTSTRGGGGGGGGLSAASTSSDAPTQDEFFECPEKFGFFPHHRSCDKYWKCEEGLATLKICGNGLIFDATDLKRESCNYPFAADCGDRTELGESNL